MVRIIFVLKMGHTFSQYLHLGREKRLNLTNLRVLILTALCRSCRRKAVFFLSGKNIHRKIGYVGVTGLKSFNYLQQTRQAKVTCLYKLLV